MENQERGEFVFGSQGRHRIYYGSVPFMTTISCSVLGSIHSYHGFAKLTHVEDLLTDVACLIEPHMTFF